MSYYRVLGLSEEPFSTSPDPAFFYESRQHHRALVRLMVEIRLRRGMSIILGDIGTGKTTLSRKIYQTLRQRPDIHFHMILDPTYESPELFFDSLARTFKLAVGQQPSLVDFKQSLQSYLYRAGVGEQKTVVLLIDEAQKLSAPALEILRVLLNYETNQYKLLQLVLLGQMELLPRLREMPNFWDRIGSRQMLAPLNQEETRNLIVFRLRKAGASRPEQLFSEAAITAVYHHSRGYPRRIAMLCHAALKEAVMFGVAQIDEHMVRALIEEELLLNRYVSLT